MACINCVLRDPINIDLGDGSAPKSLISRLIAVSETIVWTIDKCVTWAKSVNIIYFTASRIRSLMIKYL